MAYHPQLDPIYAAHLDATFGVRRVRSRPMPNDPIPSPETLPSHEGAMWRAAFAAAWVRPELDRSENGSHEAFCAETADNVLHAYRKICRSRREL